MSHNHGHDHGHDHYDGQGPIDHTHDHEHEHDDAEPALQNFLYTQLDFDRITCLNESVQGSAKAIVKKTWSERMEAEPELKSDVDEQILVSVP
jgi:hypothetical protein